MILQNMLRVYIIILIIYWQFQTFFLNKQWTKFCLIHLFLINNKSFKEFHAFYETFLLSYNIKIFYFII